METKSVKQIIDENNCQSEGEQQVRLALNEYFPGFNFIKIRPRWLKNDITGRNMELDFYCAELKLAFEYQGQQHNKFSKFYHGTSEKFASQIQRDEDKKKLCLGQGITLIEIFPKDNIFKMIEEAANSYLGRPITEKNEISNTKKEITSSEKEMSLDFIKQLSEQSLFYQIDDENRINNKKKILTTYDSPDKSSFKEIVNKLFNKNEIKAVLDQFNITNGSKDTKSDLIENLYHNTQKNIVINDFIRSKIKENSKDEIEKIKKEIEDIEKAENIIINVDNYKIITTYLNISELKDICKYGGIKMSGTRDELIERLTKKYPNIDENPKNNGKQNREYDLITFEENKYDDYENLKRENNVLQQQLSELQEYVKSLENKIKKFENDKKINDELNDLYTKKMEKLVNEMYENHKYIKNLIGCLKETTTK